MSASQFSGGIRIGPVVMVVVVEAMAAELKAAVRTGIEMRAAKLLFAI